MYINWPKNILIFFYRTLPLSKKKKDKISKCVKYIVGAGNDDKSIILSQKISNLKKMDNNSFYELFPMKAETS